MLWKNKGKGKDESLQGQEKGIGVCQYCLEHKNSTTTTTTIPVYYKHGQALRLVTICKPCQDFESETLGVKSRSVSMTDIHKKDDALEAICKVICRLTEDEHKRIIRHPNRKNYWEPVNNVRYYEAVRFAYLESAQLRDYLDCAVEQIDKDLKTLWPLTYQGINELCLGYGKLDCLELVHKNPDTLLLRWVINAPTPAELMEQQHE